MSLEEVEEEIQKNLHLIDPDSLLSKNDIKSCANTVLEKGWQVSGNLGQIKSVVFKLIEISLPAAKLIKNKISMSWIKNIATFDSLKGNNIESHLNRLKFIFEIEEVVAINKKISFTALTVDEYVSQYIKDMKASHKTSWEVFTAKLKLKYSGQLSQDMAREEVKNFKIEERNFRADAEVLYKTYRTAYQNRDEIEIIEKAQELLARNHRVWDHIQRNMSCYSDFMEMVASVDAFLKSEMKRVNIVGRVDNRKMMMQCNFCKLKGHKESECNKKAGNCFACGSSGHRMKECPKRGDSSLVKKEVRRVNKITTNGGYLLK
uniref:CCHC-type domain-containing protein n=1 Tax=Strongyloides venezuelensis TaxID=75913 RepID=A0A0K0FR95_STRVS